VAVIKYTCARCPAAGVKLWRQSHTFADCVELLCVDCACQDEGVDAATVGEDGRRRLKMYGHYCGRTDQIGGLVPAVPTEKGATYWGYTSVPQDRCDWWDRLPLRKPADEGQGASDGVSAPRNSTRTEV
jgi:hypothetical protein